METIWPRALDHCVLPTVDLSVSSERLTALGFTVAPVGQHPFGTANHCVYFADNSFLEMLVTAEPDIARQAAADGNVFVRHQLETGEGKDGFSAIVFKTEDAMADHRRLDAAGVSAGSTLDFSRAFIDAAGQQATASFRLAFAAVAEAPDVLVFTCERVAVPKVDRAALQRHANGVAGIKSVTAIGSDASALEPIRTAFGEPDGRTVLDIRPIDPWNYSAPVYREELCLSAISFVVPHLSAVENLLRAGGIDFSAEPGAIVVSPAPGQGATFLFEASK